MGNFCEQRDKEYMKRTMLKQEETLRDQVHELHRLYGVQKKMMKEYLKADLKRQRVSSSLQSKIQKWNAEADRHEQYNSCSEEESDLELTLAINGNRRKMKLLSPMASEQESPCLHLSLVS